MRHRILFLVLGLVSVACSDGNSGADSQAETDQAGISATTTPGACQLPAALLATALPRTLLDQPATIDTFSFRDGDPERAANAQATTVSLGYGQLDEFRPMMQLMITDASRHDLLRSSLAETVSNRSPADDRYATVERRQSDLGPVFYTYDANERVESLTVSGPNDLYLVLSHYGDAGADRLLTALAGSGAARALAFDCETPVADVPAWLRTPEARPAAERAADTAGPSVAPGSLPSCDVILPAETVAEVCGVEKTVAKPTDFERDGENCNRMYGLPGKRGGLVFLLTNYGDGSQAASALAASRVRVDNTSQYAALPDLGQEGERYVHEATVPTYTTRFASRGVLVELKNAESPMNPSGFCMSLEQMEALARAVDNRLGDIADP